LYRWQVSTAEEKVHDALYTTDLQWTEGMLRKDFCKLHRYTLVARDIDIKGITCSYKGWISGKVSARSQNRWQDAATGILLEYPVYFETKLYRQSIEKVLGREVKLNDVRSR